MVLSTCWFVTALGGGRCIGIVEADSAEEAAQSMGLLLCKDEECERDDGDHAHVNVEGLEVSKEHCHLRDVPLPAFGPDVVVSMNESWPGVCFDRYPLIKR